MIRSTKNSWLWDLGDYPPPSTIHVTEEMLTAPLREIVGEIPQEAEMPKGVGYGKGKRKGRKRAKKK